MPWNKTCQYVKLVWWRQQPPWILPTCSGSTTHWGLLFPWSGSTTHWGSSLLDLGARPTGATLSLIWEHDPLGLLSPWSGSTTHWASSLLDLGARPTGAPLPLHNVILIVCFLVAVKSRQVKREGRKRFLSGVQMSEIRLVKKWRFSAPLCQYSILSRACGGDGGIRALHGRPCWAIPFLSWASG